LDEPAQRVPGLCERRWVQTVTPNVSPRIVGGLLAVLAMGATALADDYPPITCTAHAAYRGAPLHAPVKAALTGTMPDAALSPALTATLDQVFEQMKTAANADALGIAVGRMGEGLWSRNALPLGSRRLWWASAGKMFVAVVVLQLVEEKRLSLDDVVSRWVTGVPNGDVVTVRDLLAHTSGLFSANEDLLVHAKPHYLAHAEMLALLQKHGAMFCPGASWRYSNSGYDLLGEIIQAVDGRPFEEAIVARIVKPLDLSSVEVLHGGVPAPDVAPPVSAKEPVMGVSVAGAGGAVAADPSDMVRFLAAVLGGKLLKPKTVSAMFAQLYPMFDAGTYYGLGAMVFDVNDGARHDVWFGHAGGAPGVEAVIVYSPADRAIVAVALTGDGPATAVANSVLKRLRTPSP
jgi:D-alanyl-D-alanine carboxypeptidase